MQKYFIPEIYLTEKAAQCLEKEPALHHCVLHTPCQPVLINDILREDFQTVLKQAYQRMCELQGIGIAANQLGMSYQFFLIERDPTNSRYQTVDNTFVPLRYYINPHILKASEEKIALYHGCLSCAGAERGLVATYQTITVEYYDEHAIKQVREISDWEAIIFQHELNHLLGRTYLNVAQDFAAEETLRAQYQGKVPAPRLIQQDEIIPLLTPLT